MGGVVAEAGACGGDVEVEGATVARQFADAEESWRVRVTRFDDFVRLEIENRSEQPVLQLQLYAEGLLGTTWRPTRGRGYRVDWRRGAIVAFDQEIDRRREGLARYYDFDHERPLEELRFRAGRRHGVQRRFEADGTVHETVYEDGFVPPVVAPRRRVDGTRVEFRADGSVVYEAPAEIVRRLRVGWTVQRVADVLGQPISEAQGVLVPGGCTPGCGSSSRRTGRLGRAGPVGGLHGRPLSCRRMHGFDPCACRGCSVAAGPIR
ncbi:MAG: hypothetical protein H6722_12840 [Sandaracinus sp.]|nr:hypothetical protein [Sandaracinus sp.]